MSTYTDKTKVKRIPKRGHYDKETIYRILDGSFLCHVGFVHNQYPVVIPTLYGRKDNLVYVHGSNASRMMNDLSVGIPMCLSVTKVNGIVLARSAFHHSMNYESVVLFGTAVLIEDYDEKMEALKVVSENILPGRWDETRLPIPKEMKATKVLKIEIEEASAKVRTGPPGDDKPDYELDIWAGVLPINQTYGQPIPDELLKAGVPLAKSVESALNENL